jgi:hypothetical protein
MHPMEELFTTLAHLHRKTKEKKTKETNGWLQISLGEHQGYKPPTTKRPDEKATQVPKRLATRYYQLKIGHAIIATHLKRINAINDDRCWWCNTDKRQTVRHLFKECRKWRSEREEMKKKIKPGLWSHNNRAHMFEDKECTELILKFIKEMEVGNKSKEKDQEKKDEETDGVNGWEELLEHPWVEELHQDEEEDDEELMAWDGDGEGHVTQGTGVG